MGRNGRTGPMKPSAGRSGEERRAAFLALRIERGLDGQDNFPGNSLRDAVFGYQRAHEGCLALTATRGL